LRDKNFDFECVLNYAANTDGKKSSVGSSKKKKSSKSSRKKSGKIDKTSDHDEDDVDATDGYDTCSSEKCLQPTGKLATVQRASYMQ